MKRVLMLVLLLGVAGAVVYALRTRSSSSEPVPLGARHVLDEDHQSAPAMRVREAGSATA